MKSYHEVLAEALLLNEKKNKIISNVLGILCKEPCKRTDPNQGIYAIAKTQLFSTQKLSGQIIEALRKGHILLALIGMRPLFELSINTEYIFNHPKYKGDSRHMRRVCKSVVALANKKRKVNHTKIDQKFFADRLKEVKGKHWKKFHSQNYRGLSEWAHLMIRTPYLSVKADGEKLGMGCASQALSCAHDVIESISSGLNLTLDKDWKDWEKALSQFTHNYEK